MFSRYLGNRISLLFRELANQKPRNSRFVKLFGATVSVVSVNRIGLTFFSRHNMDAPDRTHGGRGSDVSGNTNKTNDIADGSVKSKGKRASKIRDAKHATRGKAEEEEPYEKWKNEYLELPLDEKRKRYKCGSSYKTLKDIPTWEDFYPTIKKRKNVKRTPPIQPVKKVNKTLNSKVSLWVGDITTLEIDAIANAANTSLMGGGGVDGAIHSAAGSLLKRECRELNGCKTGEAEITGGYNLPAKYIIHTVGPMGEYKEDLQNCYKNCLKHVKENDLTAIAFPCISTGIYGYPNKEATIVALETVREWLEKDGNSIDRVIFCLFLQIDVNLYERHMMEYFPVGDTGRPAQESEQPMDTQSAGDKTSPKEQTKKKATRTSSKSKISDNQKESADMDTTESNTEVKNVPATGEDDISLGEIDVKLQSEPKDKQDKKTPEQQRDQPVSDKKSKAKTGGKPDPSEKVMDTSLPKAEQNKTPKPGVKPASTKSTAPEENLPEVETENGAKPDEELNTSADVPKSDAGMNKQFKGRQKKLGESPENKKQKSTGRDDKCNL